VSRQRFKQKQSHIRPVLKRKILCNINNSYRIKTLVDDAGQYIGDPYLSITVGLEETKVYTLDAIFKRINRDLSVKECLIAEKYFMENT
jgi:hypothetical protein